jgi:hypothetical protein
MEVVIGERAVYLKRDASPFCGRFVHLGCGTRTEGKKISWDEFIEKMNARK